MRSDEMNKVDFFVESKAELRHMNQVEKMLQLPITQAITCLKALEGIKNIEYGERFTLRKARSAFLDEIDAEPKFEGMIDQKALKDFIIENYLFERFTECSYQELIAVC